MTRGVKKVNEKIVEAGRALIITDRLAADWEDIPYGSLHIDPITGDFYVKLIGHDDWVRVEVGSNPNPGDGGWEGELPYGPLTPEEVAAIIKSMRERIQAAEFGTGGRISNWPTLGNQTAEIKMLRTKVIDLYESAHRTSSSFFASLPAKDMSQAFNVIETGLEMYIEGITGLSSNFEMVKLQINELLEIIYPGSYIANELVNAHDIAKQLRVVYEAIGQAKPNWIQDSGLPLLSTREILEKCSASIVLLKDVYYPVPGAGRMALNELEEEIETLLTFVGEN